MAEKKQVNARVPDDIYTCVVARARLQEESNGHYLGLIARQRFAQGQPSVTEYEAQVRKHLRERALDGGRSSVAASSEGAGSAVADGRKTAAPGPRHQPHHGGEEINRRPALIRSDGILLEPPKLE